MVSVGAPSIGPWEGAAAHQLMSAASARDSPFCPPIGCHRYVDELSAKLYGSLQTAPYPRCPLKSGKDWFCFVKQAYK